jgi:hypothetical protein
MKTKCLCAILLCSIFTVVSCNPDPPVLPIKTPISDPIIIKPVIKKDTVLLPAKTIYGPTYEN